MGMALQRGGDARYRVRCSAPHAVPTSSVTAIGEVAAILALLRLPSTGPLGDLDAEVVGAADALVTTLDDSQVADRARALGVLSVVYQNTAEWNRQAELADEALALARGLGDELTLAAVLAYVSWSALRPDLPAGEAEALAAELVALAHRVGEPEAECLGLNLLGMGVHGASRSRRCDGSARPLFRTRRRAAPPIPHVGPGGRRGHPRGARRRSRGRRGTRQRNVRAGRELWRAAVPFNGHVRRADRARALVAGAHRRAGADVPQPGRSAARRHRWQAALALALAESGDTEGARRELDAIARARHRRRPARHRLVVVSPVAGAGR